MYGLLLAVIYLAFISLGLPDSLLGAGWPVMQSQLDVPVSFAGILTMIIALGTVVSSLFSDTLTRKFGAGKVTAVSVLMTALALLGFSFSSEFWMLVLWAIPYGLGAGAVDAALNNYVALHYAARHMSWLHCFWGIGASISPYIMSFALSGGYGWHSGYQIVGILQLILTVLLFVTLPLWKKVRPPKKQAEIQAAKENPPDSQEKHSSLLTTLKTAGVIPMLIAFCSYSAVEQTSMLWASSYLVQQRGIAAETAAGFASLFFLGITLGRLLSGFVSEKLGDKRLIRIGIVLILIGIGLCFLPWEGAALSGLAVIGLGCAPVYPSIIHATPFNFGANRSQAVIGVEMAGAYIGTTFLPPLFGWLASQITIGLLPVYLLFFTLLMLGMTEGVNRIVAKRR